MSRTENFRRQHREIHQVVREIDALLEIEDLKREPVRVRLLLSELAGKLSVHLAMEDNALYPRLMNHKDPQVATLASRYMSEMGGIKSAFLDYSQRWRVADAVERAPQAFIEETRVIFDALARRIHREDNELYPLVDKHG